MTAMPLAEAYEKLKDLRRQGDSDGDEVRSIFRSMRDRFAVLAPLPPTHEPEGFVRIIEAITLAERVLGEKADAWLRRPNSALSGQRPFDLLKDELGAAVVREMLERIDHGIFA